MVFRVELRDELEQICVHGQGHSLEEALAHALLILIDQKRRARMLEDERSGARVTSTEG